jgi:biotin-(acetyl-CoA carboxylase) ligase
MIPVSCVKARELLKNETHNGLKYFAVAADHQSRGRGTRGREWVSGSRNLFLTVVIRRNLIPLPITLLPLRYSQSLSAVNDCIIRHLSSSPITLKGRHSCRIMCSGQNQLFEGSQIEVAQ